MKRLKPRFEPHCCYCTRPESECGQLSCRGICRECAREAMVANALQVQAKRGPYAKRCLEGEVAAAQKRLDIIEKAA